MALPISPLSTDDVRGVLVVTGPSSFGALCNNITVNEAGLDPVYCPDLGAGRLANLRTIPYLLNKFRNYDHYIIPVVDIWKMVGAPVWYSGGTWTYDTWANSFDPINNGIDVSFGFDASYAGSFYDASIIHIPSWITLKNNFNDTLYEGDSVSPYQFENMRAWPNSPNGGGSDRVDSVDIANNYSGTCSWAVVQGHYIAPPSINDWLTADVSMVYNAPYPMSYMYPAANPGDEYIHMMGGFKYVLTLTNVSTNTINFGIDCSVAVVSKSQYEVMEEGYDFPGPYLSHVFYSGSIPPLPSSIPPGGSWSSGVMDIRYGGIWDSSTNYNTDSLWSLNEFWPNVYFTGWVGASYDNVVVAWGNTNPALIHDPSISYSPASKNFSKDGGSQVIDIDFDTYWWDGVWSISESLPWINITGGSGSGPGSFTINCDPQPGAGGSARNGYVTINAFQVSGSPSYTVYVSQDASEGPLPAGDVSIYFTEDGSIRTDFISDETIRIYYILNAQASNESDSCGWGVGPTACGTYIDPGIDGVAANASYSNPGENHSDAQYKVGYFDVNSGSATRYASLDLTCRGDSMNCDIESTYSSIILSAAVKLSGTNDVAIWTPKGAYVGYPEYSGGNCAGYYKAAEIANYILDVSSVFTNKSSYTPSESMSITTWIRNISGTPGYAPFDWKIVNGSDVTQSSGTDITASYVSPLSSSSKVTSASAPASDGTYYVKCKMYDDSVWVTSASFTVTSAYLNISSGYSGYWYFDEYGAACSNNGEWDTITVSSNTSWTVTPGASWIHESPHSGSGNDTVTIIVDPGTNRNAVVTFSASGCPDRTAHIWQMDTGETCV